MTAREIVVALGGRWHGAAGCARCPVPGHGKRRGDHNPSLSVRDGDGGRLLLFCHGGCDSLDVLAELRHRGLLPELSRSSASTPSSAAPSPRTEDNGNRDSARRIWHEARPAAGTLAHDYLRQRGIAIPPPITLRFHPNLRHGPTGLHLPALVAAVSGDDGRVRAVQRAYLDHHGRKASVSSPKRTLGPIAGGAVRLAPAADVLALCEGVEDAMSLVQMTGRPAWASLGTSNLANIVLSEIVQTVVIASDADAAGDAAVAEAARRFATEGRRVLRLRPPDGMDWTDLLPAFDERAGIRQFDGDQDRAEAELAAFAEAVGGSLAHV